MKKILIVSIFSLLLPLFVSANTQSDGVLREYTSTLVEGIVDKDIKAVRKAIAEGADVNLKEREGMTPLMFAVRLDSPKIAKLLLDNKADVNAKNQIGNTALMLAAENGNTEMAELLIKYGAAVDERNMFKATPLMWSRGGKKLAELLIKNGADVNAKDWIHETVLMWNARRNKDVVALLIKEGADVNATSLKGEHAIDFAEGDAEKILVENGAKFDINKQIVEAVLNNDNDLVDFYIARGGKLDIKDSYNKNTLMYAAEGNNVKAAKRLIAQGVDVNAADKKGHTALMYAAKRGSKDAAEVLLKNGADVNIKDKLTHTAYFYAQDYGHKKVIELLTKKDAEEEISAEDNKPAVKEHEDSEILQAIAEEFLAIEKDYKAKNPEASDSKEAAEKIIKEKYGFTTYEWNTFLKYAKEKNLL